MPTDVRNKEVKTDDVKLFISKRSFESLPTLIQNWLMAARLGVRRRWFPFLKEIDAVNLPLKLTFHGPTQQEYLKCRWTRGKPTPLLLVPQYPLKLDFLWYCPELLVPWTIQWGTSDATKDNPPFPCTICCLLVYTLSPISIVYLLNHYKTEVIIISHQNWVAYIPRSLALCSSGLHPRTPVSPLMEPTFLMRSQS